MEFDCLLYMQKSKMRHQCITWSVSLFPLPEFDKFMEEHKVDLQHIEIKDDITDAEFEAQEIDIDNADQQVGNKSDLKKK